MKVTSSQAGKMLRKLEDDMDGILTNETNSRDFLASVGEDVESVRPAYDYAETQEKLVELENKIRSLKHAINVFNSTQEVPGFGMTIDQMLIYLPQLSRRREKLRGMKSVLPKAREENRYGKVTNIIDYRYANYDIAAVEKDYNEISDTLAKAQNALDTVNTTVIFEVEI